MKNMQEKGNVELQHMKTMQEKLELLKKAVKNIMTECTQMWSDNVAFDNDAAKSVLALYQFNLFCLAVPTQFAFQRFLVMIL